MIKKILGGILLDHIGGQTPRTPGEEVSWINQYDGGPHEANFLKLDCSKIKTALGWKPTWNVEKTMEKIVEWSNIYRRRRYCEVYG